MKAKWMVMLALGALVGFASCKKDDDGPSSPLEESKWELKTVELDVDAEIGISGLRFRRDEEEYDHKYQSFDKGRLKINVIFSNYYDNCGNLIVQSKSKMMEEWSDFDYHTVQYASKGDFIYSIDYDVSLLGKMKKDGDELTIESITKDEFVEAYKKMEEVVEEYLAGGENTIFRERQVLKIRSKLMKYKNDAKFQENQDKPKWKLVFKRVEIEE